ncbi:carbohydrate-binding module family 50 protein, partial [Daedalea quercina L-15889]
CSRNYTVQAGDICDSISAAQNVSTYQLATVNPGIDTHCDNLTPGEQLCLGYVGSDCTDTYVVQANETCDDVASAYSMNSTVLLNNNPNIDADCSNMYIGEVRSIPLPRMLNLDLMPDIRAGPLRR